MLVKDVAVESHVSLPISGKSSFMIISVSSFESVIKPHFKGYRQQQLSESSFIVLPSLLDVRVVCHAKLLLGHKPYP
jgi:hypothetical protein